MAAPEEVEKHDSSVQTSSSSEEVHEITTDVANVIVIGSRRFEVDAELGRGAFSTVKKAFDENTRKRVALKISYIDGSMPAKERQQNIMQSRKEIHALRQMVHPNIVKLYGYDLNTTYNGRRCIVMAEELATGGQLYDYIRYEGAFGEELGAFAFKEVMNGLFAAHDKGFAHRDLKPENILLGRDFRIKIADFGFVFNFMKEDEFVDMRTRLGTRGYMAPEIIAREPYTHKVDYFAMGVILFIMLLGAPPFRQVSHQCWFYRHLDERKYRLFWMAHAKNKPMLSAVACAMVQGVLNTNPADRFDKDQIQSHPFWTNSTMTFEESQVIFAQRRQSIMQKQQQSADRSVGALYDLLENTETATVLSLTELCGTDENVLDIPLSDELEQYKTLDSQSPPAYDRELHTALSSWYARCSFGILAWFVKEWACPTNGEARAEMEIDADNCEIELKFTMDKVDEVPVEGTEDDADENEIQFEQVTVEECFSVVLKMYHDSVKEINLVTFEQRHLWEGLGTCLEEYNWVVKEILSLQMLSSFFQNSQDVVRS